MSIDGHDDGDPSHDSVARIEVGMKEGKSNEQKAKFE